MLRRQRAPTIDDTPLLTSSRRCMGKMSRGLARRERSSLGWNVPIATTLRTTSRGRSLKHAASSARAQGALMDLVAWACSARRLEAALPDVSFPRQSATRTHGVHEAYKRPGRLLADLVAHQLAEARRVLVEVGHVRVEKATAAEDRRDGCARRPAINARDRRGQLLEASAPGSAGSTARQGASRDGSAAADVTGNGAT